MWAAFKDFLFMDVLVNIQHVVGDWGMSIVVLTVIVRLLLMPLTVKQTKSMLELQRIQPKIKELQKKYADDKEKLQEETLKFYQDNKVNPFGGCLPMLLQMPLFIALYQVIGGTAKNPGLLMKHLAETGTVGKFYFFIHDISLAPSVVFSQQGLLAALPYIILLLLFGLSVWLPQALTPGDKQQKTMGATMAVMMLFVGWNAPAGVLLYWDISSIWGIVQQQVMTKMAKRDDDQDIVIEQEPKASKKASVAPAQKSTGNKNKKK